jgi:hypothetical protein
VTKVTEVIVVRAVSADYRFRPLVHSQKFALRIYLRTVSVHPVLNAAVISSGSSTTVEVCALTDSGIETIDKATDLQPDLLILTCNARIKWHRGRGYRATQIAER